MSVTQAESNFESDQFLFQKKHLTKSEKERHISYFIYVFYFLCISSKLFRFARRAVGGEAEAEAIAEAEVAAASSVRLRLRGDEEDWRGDRDDDSWNACQPA